MSATARVPSRAADSAPAGFLPQATFGLPVVRADLVERPALLGALRPLDNTCLVLVGAPAGSGKTTLLAQWARSPGAPAGSGKTTLLAQWARSPAAPAVAWVALDESDDDPVLFWTCVLEALCRLEAGPGARVEGALDAGADLVEYVLPLLLDEPLLVTRRTVLVLDDLHLVSAARGRRRSRRCTGGPDPFEPARARLERLRDPGRAPAMLDRAEAEVRAPSGRRLDPGDELSERELAVLRRLPSERYQREIGAVLYVAVKTVKSHVRAIHLKLSTDSRAGALARARELELR